MNANRMLGVTTSSQGKTTEKLSSGYKINRAADDAAGLSISEKMRKQVRGLTQASANAEDGISAVQTAEGALTEVHDMLQRMNELAVKAANGTMSSSDRMDVQNEIKQLTTEIDRVAETTKFNETYLLKGDPDGTSKTEYLTFKDAGFGKYMKVEDPTAEADKGTHRYGAFRKGRPCPGKGQPLRYSFHRSYDAGYGRHRDTSCIKVRNRLYRYGLHSADCERGERRKGKIP